MSHMIVPFVDLKAQYISIQKEIDEAIERVISNAHFIGGEEVQLFEEEFATYIGAKHCIAVNSGTDALILGIRALGLQAGDEVIVPVNTFIATALGVTENGLTPVFVDMDRQDYGIDISDLKKKITKKTKAIIVVHLYGQSDKIDEIQHVIKDSGQNILLIEDACQAHGAMYISQEFKRSQRVGSFGALSAFSFYPGKNLGAYGDGGAIVTNDDELALRYRKLREYGQEKKYVHVSLGINSRLDTIQAAVLRVKLKHLDTWNKKRQEWATYYTKKIADLELPIKTPVVFSNRKSIYHVYLIEVENRDGLLEYLHTRGVQSLIHYPTPLHLQKAFAYLGYKKGDFPNAEKSAKRILSLPMHPNLTKRQVDTVIKLVKEFYRP